MSFEYRRVVTGHSAEGLAMVRQDQVIASQERLPGYQASTIWCTAQLPVDNDERLFNEGQPGEKGSRVLIRVGEMQPGESEHSQMHRTETLDYAVILSGQCDMALDGGEIVKGLKAGDVVVQRGTNHQWIATGPGPVRFLFVLIDAHAVRCGDQVLAEDLGQYQGKIRPMP